MSIVEIRHRSLYLASDEACQKTDWQIHAWCLRHRLLVLLLVFSGCNGDVVTIQERPLPTPNPTTYEFDAPLEDVKHAIEGARGEKWRDAQNPYEGSMLMWKRDASPKAENFLAKPGNEHDAYLYGMGNAVGKSVVYFKDTTPLTYYADFQIHLTPVNPARTRVEIITRDSHVEAGTERHLVSRAGIFVEVPPTSVEEYQILLDVGKQLGVKGMPMPITPDPNAPLKELKAPRRR